MLGRRSLIAAAGLAPVVSILRAQADSDPATAAAAAPIARLNAALLEAMKLGKSAPFPRRFALLEAPVDAAFDLPAILHASVGVKWAEMADQAALNAAFRRYTIATYAANFDEFSGERFEIDPEIRPAGADRIVQTRIVPAKGDTIRLDFVMRESGTAWRAVDVLVNGAISRVAVQRSDFRGIIAKGGGAALLDMLRRKIADLSGRTVTG